MKKVICNLGLKTIFFLPILLWFESNNLKGASNHTEKLEKCAATIILSCDETSFSLCPSLCERNIEIASWLEYYCRQMIRVHEQLLLRIKDKQVQEEDQLENARTLDPIQRKLLTLFKDQAVITAKNIANFFSLKTRTANALCQQLVKKTFLVVIDPSKRARKYGLRTRYKKLLNI